MFKYWTPAEWLQILNIISTIIVALIGVVGVKVSRDTHVAVNSRMDEMLSLTRIASHAEGVKDEKATQK